MKLIEWVLLLIVGWLQARRERRLDLLEERADIAIENAWREPIKRAYELPPGTVEQDLLKEFRLLEEEIKERRRNEFEIPTGLPGETASFPGMMIPASREAELRQREALMRAMMGQSQLEQNLLAQQMQAQQNPFTGFGQLGNMLGGLSGLQAPRCTCGGLGPDQAPGLFHATNCPMRRRS